MSIATRLAGNVFVAREAEVRLKGRKVIVILEKACLKTIEGKNKTLELANSTKHKRLLLKTGDNVEDCRPDIVYQCLLQLLDSVLNRQGLLLTYIHTSDNQLIEVNPQLQLPNSYIQFEKLMITLLTARAIYAKHTKATLMRLVKNDIENIIPPGSEVIGLTATAEKMVDLSKFTTEMAEEAERKILKDTNLPPKKLRIEFDSIPVALSLRDAVLIEQSIPVVYVIGAVAKSNPTTKSACPIVQSEISISGNHLTAANVCGSLCACYEDLWCFPVKYSV